MRHLCDEGPFVPSIFISYRRRDSAHNVGRLYDRLERVFGRDSVFMDVESISVGASFVKVIMERLAASDTVLVAIGPRWLEDLGDGPSIFEPSDLVRREIVEALSQDRLVLPVLFDDARMPNANELPDDIRELANLNALKIRHGEFENDVEVLLRAIERRVSRDAILLNAPVQESSLGQVILACAREDGQRAHVVGRALEQSGYTIDFLTDETDPLEDVAPALLAGAKLVIVTGSGAARSRDLQNQILPIVHARQFFDRLVVLRIARDRSPGFLAHLPSRDLSPFFSGGEIDVSRLAHALRGVLADEAGPESEFSSLFASEGGGQIVNSPIHQAPGFVGRSEEIRWLQGELRFEGQGTRLVTIHGVGGSGKSSLAREYASRTLASYQGLWWMRADTRENLLQDFAALGHAISPGGFATLSGADAIAATLGRLSTDGRKPWLLIFDDARSLDDVRDFVPVANAHVIVTTRHPIEEPGIPCLRLDGLARDEAVDFLMYRQRGATRRRGASEAALELADALKGHPLALTLAREYCLLNAVSFNEVIASLGSAQADGSPLERAIGLAIEGALRTHGCVAIMLNIIAFIAPDDIPVSLFEGMMHVNDRDGAIATLAEARLIVLVSLPGGEAGLSVHQSVQSVWRARLARDGQTDEAITSAIATIAAAFPYDSDEPSAWPVCDTLISHASAVARLDASDPDARTHLTVVLNQASIHLLSRGSLAPAEWMLVRARALLAADPVSRDEALFITETNLARLYHASGRLAEAEVVLREALRRAQLAFGRDDVRNVGPLTNLATVLADRGHLEESAELGRETLAIAEATLGMNSPEVAVALNNLSNTLQELGEGREAEQLLLRAIAITEFSRGPDDPALATRLHNLAILYQAEGRVDEARDYMERALQATREGLGEDHPALASRLRNLAWLHHATGRAADAEITMRRALEVSAAHEASELETAGNWRTAATTTSPPVNRDDIPTQVAPSPPPRAARRLVAKHMKASVADVDFKSRDALSGRERSLIPDYWAGLDRAYKNFRQGLALRERERQVLGYSEEEILNYLSTLEIADEDETLDLAHYLAETYRHHDLAAAAAVARSEEHAASARSTTASLLALMAMDASIRASNKTLLNRAARVFSTTTTEGESAGAVSSLLLLSGS